MARLFEYGRGRNWRWQGDPSRNRSRAGEGGSKVNVLARTVTR